MCAHSEMSNHLYKNHGISRGIYTPRISTWYKMVTQNILRICEGYQLFSEINFGFVTALGRNKMPEAGKITNFTYACAPISDLPSNISTMRILIWVA